MDPTEELRKEKAEADNAEREAFEKRHEAYLVWKQWDACWLDTCDVRERLCLALREAEQAFA